MRSCSSRQLPHYFVLAALAVVMGSVAPLASPAGAQAQIDISGDWNITVEGDMPTTCSASFVQSDTSLSAAIKCAGSEPGSFTGAIDPATGSFTLSGSLRAVGVAIPVDIDGVASPDGALSGTWSAQVTVPSMSGTFTGMRGLQAPSDIDLSGSWRAELAGEISAHCSVGLEQSGRDLSATLECEGLGMGTLAGTIGHAGISLSGSPFGDRLEVVADLIQDGDAFGGSWSSPSSGGTGSITAVRDAERTGEFDLTGDWSVSLSGGMPLSCQAAIRQSGEDLFGAADCSMGSPFTLMGTIDQTSGSFHLDGGFASLQGLLSGDGESIVGAWELEGGDWGGTFTGSRTAETPSLIDLSGDWDVVLRGALEGECTASISQPLAELTVTADCGELGSGTLAGRVDPLEGPFQLEGLLDALELTLAGDAAPDAGYIEGEWYGGDLGTFGCFAGVPAGGGAPGECELPAQDPKIEDEPWLAVLGAEEDEPEGGWRVVALSLLGGGLLVLGFWRLRLQV